MAEIRLLQKQEIDFTLWDNCVHKAHNSLPYAYSWYLNAVAQNWDGLVYGNYEAVMPLVWLRKLGLRCMYQPYYCQQLGVFSLSALSNGMLNDFLQVAANHASYVEVNLNKVHHVNKDAFKLIARKNLLLPLVKPYAEIRKGFAENHRRNITKAEKAGLEFRRIEPVSAFKEFYLKNINRAKEKFGAEGEAIFNKLVDVLLTQKKAIIYGAYSGTELMATVLLVSNGNRLISIINSSGSEGKAKGASHFLYNGIIKEYAESDYLIDFEGSSIASIARFYEGFGSQQETFYRWKTNIIKQASQRFM